MLPFQAPSRRFLRQFGPSISAAVLQYGVEGTAAVLAERVRSPARDAPPHIARLLKNLAAVYGPSELQDHYRKALRSCVPSRLANSGMGPR